MDGDIYPLLNQFRRSFGKYNDKLALFQALIQEGLQKPTHARKIALTVLRQAAYVLQLWEIRDERDFSFIWWTRKLLAALVKKLPEIGVREIILSHLHSLSPASVLVLDVLRFSANEPEWFLKDLCQFGKELSTSFNLKTLPQRIKDILAILAVAALLPKEEMRRTAAALSFTKKIPKSADLPNETRNLLFDIRYGLKRIELFQQQTADEKFAQYLKDINLEIPQMRWERLPEEEFIKAAVQNARDLAIMPLSHPELAERICETLIELTTEKHSALQRIASTYGILEFVDPPLPGEEESELSKRARAEISLLTLLVHDEALREMLTEVYEVVT